MKKTMLPVLLMLVAPGVGAWDEPPAPPGLVTIDEAGSFWPYTGRNYSGERTDPINLVFLGDADPRLIRQILMGLATPNPDFGCTWRDAIGTPQTSYSEGQSWQGSAVQLECGDYATLRLHLRLFRHGPYTLGGAHLEVQIPGTSSHEVLSWVIPREVVLADLMRSGHFVDQFPVPGLTDAPSWRAINPAVLNGLPLELRALLGLPTDPVSAPYPIPNDSVARVVRLWGQHEPARSSAKVEFDHPFGQGIPKPFCSGDGELFWVSGSVHMTHRVRTNRHGVYAARFEAEGTLQVVPIDSGGNPIGAPFLAEVSELHRSRLTDGDQRASMKSVQALLSNPEEWLVEKLWAGKKKVYVRKESCGTE